VIQKQRTLMVSTNIWMSNEKWEKKQKAIDAQIVTRRFKTLDLATSSLLDQSSHRMCFLLIDGSDSGSGKDPRSDKRWDGQDADRREAWARSKPSLSGDHASWNASASLSAPWQRAASLGTVFERVPRLQLWPGRPSTFSRRFHRRTWTKAHEALPYLPIGSPPGDGATANGGDILVADPSHTTRAFWKNRNFKFQLSKPLKTSRKAKLKSDHNLLQHLFYR